MSLDLSPAPGNWPMTAVTLRPITADDESDWNDLMAALHPLGNPKYAGHQMKYVAELRGHAVGLLCLSACAYHLADRDAYLGWSTEQRMMRQHFVVQNSRFLILPKVHRKNLASRILALCARRVCDDWRNRYGFSPLVLESFVDSTQFSGTCYKAAGWKQVGSSSGFRRDGEEFYVQDSHPKQIWIKLLDSCAREWLSAETMPEPWATQQLPLSPKRVAVRMGTKNLTSLFMTLQSIPDFRRAKSRRYPLGSCLAMILCGFLSGARTMEQCAAFAATLSQPQLQALRSWKNPKTGKCEAPRTTTLWRIASGVDAALLENTFLAWVSDQGMDLEAIAIDGKALRATLQNEDGGSFVVNAVNHSQSAPFFSSNSPTEKARK